MIKQEAYIGKNAITEFQHSLERISAKRVLLLRGKTSYSACGAEKMLGYVFIQEGINIREWSDFEENPKYEDVITGLEIFRSGQFDAIVACGGGSVIDMAKLIRFANSYCGDLFGNEFEKVGELIPLYAMPTTAGTGAEATPFAVCYENGDKHSVAHEDILPDYAIVYPPFTYKNNKHLTACTGFDALAQATEAYWNPNHTKESDEYALKGLKLVHDYLDKLVLNVYAKDAQSEMNARDKIAEGAYYAGKAIAITKTTAPHAFSYAFTTYCGYKHGHAVALTFPFFFELNVYRFKDKLQAGIDVKDYIQRMQTLCDAWGVQPDTSRNQVWTYIQSIDLKYKLSKMRSHEILSKVNLDRLKNNPVVVDKVVIKELEGYMMNLPIEERVLID